MKRWVKQIKAESLPSCDKKDIKKEVPQINGGKVLPEDERRQHNAEYTQRCYLRMLQHEKEYAVNNYLAADDSTMR